MYPFRTVALYEVVSLHQDSFIYAVKCLHNNHELGVVPDVSEVDARALLRCGCANLQFFYLQTVIDPGNENPATPLPQVINPDLKRTFGYRKCYVLSKRTYIGMLVRVAGFF